MLKTSLFEHTKANCNSVKRNLAVSPLLSLPPELRNRIYDLVLGGKRLWIGYSLHEHKYKTTRSRRERIHIAGGLCYHERSSLLKTLNIGLLRVCRQTYGEAALMLYALNKFAFENNWVRRKFEKGMRPAQMRAIGNYKIMDWERYSLGRTRMTSYPRSYGAQRTWR